MYINMTTMTAAASNVILSTVFSSLAPYDSNFFIVIEVNENVANRFAVWTCPVLM